MTKTQKRNAVILPPPQTQSARLWAASALLKVMLHQGSLSSSLSSAQARANPDDRALIAQLCFGACRFFPQLDIQAKALLEHPILPQHQLIHALIIIGIYELSHLRTPTYASVTSTVDAAKETELGWAAGLCNAVLRAFLRQREHDQKPQLDDQNSVIYTHNHPSWLVAKLGNHWPQQWQEILEANDHQGPMTLRVNQRQCSTEEYLTLLKAESISASLCKHSPWGIQLSNACNVNALPNFAKGWVSVQDEAAQLAPLVLDLNNGQRVLDACAAPGGKTCHLLESHELEVTAVESERRRINRLQENLARLNLAATIVCADATAVNDWWDGDVFDRILLDAPCSATGVIRRHPDIKILRQNEEIVALASLQERLLTALWPTLAVGGILVYATCSVLKQENERVIRRFLRNHQDAQEVPINAPWGQATLHGRQLFPYKDGHDGFYYAKLVKVE